MLKFCIQFVEYFVKKFFRYGHVFVFYQKVGSKCFAKIFKLRSESSSHQMMPNLKMMSRVTFVAQTIMTFEGTKFKQIICTKFEQENWF